MNRKKQLIFADAKTLFSFAVENVSRKDMRERFPELFRKGLGQALFIEGASSQVMKKMIELCNSKIIFAKTLKEQFGLEFIPTQDYLESVWDSPDKR